LIYSEFKKTSAVIIIKNPLKFNYNLGIIVTIRNYDENLEAIFRETLDSQKAGPIYLF